MREERQMTRSARRRLAALLCISACATPLGVASAAGSGAGDNGLRPKDNGALAIARTDGADEFDFAWSIERQRGGAVDNLNVARAISNECSNCKATAIALQIVLAVKADSVTPTNRAEAINNEARNARAYAFAPQFVRVLNEPARFTRDGRSTLADVRHELRDLEGQDLTLAQLQAAVEAQRQRVREVLASELVPVSGTRPVRTLERADRAPSDG
jgi:hypothetical protein